MRICRKPGFSGRRWIIVSFPPSCVRRVDDDDGKRLMYSEVDRPLWALYWVPSRYIGQAPRYTHMRYSFNGAPNTVVFLQRWQDLVTKILRTFTGLALTLFFSGILINACLINCERARGFDLPFLLCFMVFMIAFPTYMEDFVVFLMKKIDLKLFSRPSGWTKLHSSTE